MIGWLRRWGWLVAFIIAAIVIVIVTVGAVRPDIKREIEVAKADAEATKLEAKVGWEEAVKRIEEEHKTTLESLNGSQRFQAEKLKEDPVALSRFLVRAGSGKRTA